MSAGSGILHEGLGGVGETICGAVTVLRGQGGMSSTYAGTSGK
jgi:hypothetical protein